MKTVNSKTANSKQQTANSKTDQLAMVLLFTVYCLQFLRSRCLLP